MPIEYAGSNQGYPFPLVTRIITIGSDQGTIDQRIQVPGLSTGELDKIKGFIGLPHELQSKIGEVYLLTALYNSGNKIARPEVDIDNAFMAKDSEAIVASEDHPLPTYSPSDVEHNMWASPEQTKAVIAGMIKEKLLGISGKYKTLSDDIQKIVDNAREIVRQERQK